MLTRALLAGGALAVAQGAPGLTALAPVRRRFPGLAGAGAADHVALTFDDGPDPRFTPRFLAALAARRVHATFFLLGPMVQAAPQLAAEIAAAGHEIGVHGWDHRYATVRGPGALHDDLARACDTIAAATGTVPRLYRPPYGVLSAGALIAARRLGLRPVLWSTWGREWIPGATPESVQATLARTLDGGETVLLHDSDAVAPPGTATAALGALPWLLDECARRALRAGPLAEHLADGAQRG
jgi:peptidoglycan/xylan/chitin deacetylase (PgdA/CDA1 family)